jgi:hypothetical protein
MMKKIIYLFILTAFSAGCSTTPHFVVKGNIAGSDSMTFLLQKRGTARYETIDSVVSKKGIFKMTGTVEYPEMVILTAMNTMNRMVFFLENTTIEINGKLDSLVNAKVTGSRTQDEYKTFQDADKILSDRYTGFYKEVFN